MATKNHRRKRYISVKKGGTCVDLTRVCAYTFTAKHGNYGWCVDFHMDSGTIFSVEMSDEDKVELDKIWAYWRDK